MTVPTRILVLVAAFYALVQWCRVWHSLRPAVGYLALTATAYLIHAILFGICVWARVLPPLYLNLWSQAVRLHAIVMLVLVARNIKKGLHHA